MMDQVFRYIWILVQFLIGYNLVLPVFLLLLKRKSPPSAPLQQPAGEEPDYAIIVTAFQETELLPAVVDSILKLHYHNFLVYIVADNCDISALDFKDERIVLLCPEEIIASNTGSLLYAVERFRRDHERFTIIDSDNLVHPDFLGELNKFFDTGYEAVQGLRKAKNLNSIYACLDAARDIYYHFYDGKLLFGSGSSATLSGSGMAFSLDLYNKHLRHLQVKGAGFDKVWQAAIVRQDLRIAFAPDAVVYDEKTSGSGQLVKQRSRWINTWFSYYKYGFQIIRKGLRNTSINQVLFGLVLLRPPLFIFLLLSLLCVLIDMLIQPGAVLIWVLAFLLFTAGFAIALIRSETDKRILRSLINIPQFVALQVIALIRIKTIPGSSLTTRHSERINIQDITPAEKDRSL